MNQRHEKNLRIMLGVSDAKTLISDEPKSRIEQMEIRMTRFFGRFTEMHAETLALLVSDFRDEQVFVSLEPTSPPERPSEASIKDMSRGDIGIELEKLGVTVLDSNKLSAEALRKELLKELGKLEPAVE